MGDGSVHVQIGYWRYISIYRHLQRNPDHQIYPLFEYFENWCQDENRHGDFFSALLKSQPQVECPCLSLLHLTSRFHCTVTSVVCQLMSFYPVWLPLQPDRGECPCISLHCPYGRVPFSILYGLMHSSCPISLADTVRCLNEGNFVLSGPCMVSMAMHLGRQMSHLARGALGFVKFILEPLKIQRLIVFYFCASCRQLQQQDQTTA